MCCYGTVAREAKASGLRGFGAKQSISDTLQGLSSIKAHLMVAHAPRGIKHQGLNYLFTDVPEDRGVSIHPLTVVRKA